MSEHVRPMYRYICKHNRGEKEEGGNESVGERERKSKRKGTDRERAQQGGENRCCTPRMPWISEAMCVRWGTCLLVGIEWLLQLLEAEPTHERQCTRDKVCVLVCVLPGFPCFVYLGGCRDLGTLLLVGVAGG